MGPDGKGFLALSDRGLGLVPEGSGQYRRALPAAPDAGATPQTFPGWNEHGFR